MELAAALHHSRDGGRETYYGLRAPKSASSEGRPGVLKEPEPPNVVDRVQRHTVEQRIEHMPYVQILDAPVPQKVEQLVDFFKDLDIEVPAQVIEVPKISQDIIPQRSVDLVPQMVEQLVEVPTILTPTRIAVQIAEQIVGIPVPHGVVQVLSQERAHQRLANAFLSGLCSRSSIFQFRLSRRSLTLLLVMTVDWARPHLLVLLMRIFLVFFVLFPIEKKCGVPGRW